MAPISPVNRGRAPDGWYLSLVEVGRPDGGVLYAEEVEGAFAWAAVEARGLREATRAIRQIFARDGLRVVRLESLFACEMEDIRRYDRRLAAALERSPDAPRGGRGALCYFAAEAEA